MKLAEGNFREENAGGRGVKGGGHATQRRKRRNHGVELPANTTQTQRCEANPLKVAHRMECKQALEDLERCDVCGQMLKFLGKPISLVFSLLSLWERK